MEHMTTDERNSKIQHDCDDAHQDLEDTLHEIGAKFTSAEDGLRPDRLIESHAVGASLIAGAIGLWLGSTSTNRATAPMIIAALLGFAFSKRYEDQPDEDDAK